MIQFGVSMGVTYRIPDVCVVRSDLAASGRDVVVPADLALTVEVVSPASQTTDRITNPAQYAEAGIGAYCRVEIDEPMGLTAYELGSGATAYREAGTWGRGEVAHLARPFAVDIAVDDLLS